MLLKFDFANWLPSFIGAIAIAIGSLTAVAALRKVPAERTGILVDAAQDVVLIQKEGLEQLKTQLKEAHDRIARLEAHVEELEHAVYKMETIEQENTRLAEENAKLLARLHELEGKST